MKEIKQMLSYIRSWYDNYNSSKMTPTERLFGDLLGVVEKMAERQEAMAEHVHEYSYVNPGHDVYTEQPKLPSGRLLQIRALMHEIGKVSEENDGIFGQLVDRAMTMIPMTDGELAMLFSASRPTVTRWRKGTDVPHTAMRRPIYNELLNKLHHALDEEEANL